MTVDIGPSSSSSAPPPPPSAIFFFHSQSARALRYVADLDSPADLGSIAGFFSLLPISLRLNGYFISSSSRGAHNASSPSRCGAGPGGFVSQLSWRQILSFFDCRGFASGSNALYPISVEGRPRQSGQSQSRQEDCGEDAFCTERGQGTALVEEEIIQRVKRAKYGSKSSSDFSMMSTPRASKLKCRLREDELVSCTLSKRRHLERDALEKHDWHLEDHESEGSSGFKRKRSGEETSGYGQLWKRLKEIRV